MNDSYQPIYDAVRNSIRGSNVGEIVAEQARQAFDISFAVQQVQQEFLNVAFEQQRPFILLRPKIAPDGNMWCCLYGDNLMEGVAGFGETPALAAADFDKNWHSQKMICATPTGATP